jgi:hypothetical protein
VTLTTLRRVKPDAYAVIPGGWISLAMDIADPDSNDEAASTGLVSRLYSLDGVLLSVRGSTTGFVGKRPDHVLGIATDPLGNVGPGSFAFVDSRDRVVWDPAGGLSTHTPTVGRVVTTMAYAAGYLYWGEMTAGNPSTFYLVRATCDLGTVEEISSVAVTASDYGTWIFDVTPICLTSTVAIISRRFQLSSDPGESDSASARIPLDGSPGTFDGSTGFPEGSALAGATIWPDDASGSAGFNYRQSDDTIGWGRISDSLASGTWVLTWPQSGTWRISEQAGQEMSGAQSVYVSPDGATGYLFGFDFYAAGDPGKMIVAPVAATTGTPTVYTLPDLPVATVALIPAT